MTNYLGRFLETAAPAVEPVTVTEFKNDARFSSADFDATLIPLRLEAARQEFEDLTYLATISRTFRMTLDERPDERVLEIPLAPLVSIESIQYYDPDNVLQTIDAGDYHVETVNKPGRVELVLGLAWPAMRLRVGRMLIDFTAGFGAAAADIPARVKTAIIWIAKDRFYQPAMLSQDTMRLVESCRWRHLVGGCDDG